MIEHFEASRVLGALKDFQLATVGHAYHRLFEAKDSTRRFLVADEVGLGKTLVAGGVIAKAIERLRADGVERIDIVYVCSNGDIASQNVRKLDVMGSGAAVASRLTLLATRVKDLERRPLNLVALTPGTSFNLRSAMGVAEERVLLHALLEEAWPFRSRAGPMNLLQGTVTNTSGFRQWIHDFDRSAISPAIAASFTSALEQREEEDQTAGQDTIRERFDALCDVFGKARKRRNIPHHQRDEQRGFIADLRGLLAAACVEALEPDLVILDEFQRFRNLLEDDGSTAASLARSLFNWHRPGTDEQARLLLLSATPYRALTVAGDGGDDDHHEDFLATVGFLFGDVDRCDELRGLLRAYRRELYGADPSRSAGLHEIGGQIEVLLGKVIARTERIGAAGQHNAMLRSQVRTSMPTTDDVRQYLMVQDVAQQLGQPDVTELWKSASFLINFLDGYQLRNRFDGALDTPASARALAEILGRNKDLLLDQKRIRSYAPIDPGGARMRELARDVLDSDAWRLLWIPPSLPYHRLGGAYATPALKGFTKRLVFSAWRAVPRAAAGLLSYLAERRLALEADPGAQNTPTRRSRQRNRLQFTRDPNGRLTGMPALSLLYPSPTLATAADPLAFSASNPDGDIPELLFWARERVRAVMGRLPAGDPERDEDERWYWAAPLLLDAAKSESWWDNADLAAAWTGQDPDAYEGDSRWSEHVERARITAAGRLDPPLGRRPSDLEEFLARLALGAPGTLALRAIDRVTGLEPHDLAARVPAARVAWGLRALFNSPEATALLRASRTGTFWREVLQHAIDGDLQAVLDEHAHILLEAEGLKDKPPASAAEVIADAMTRALSVRASRVTYSELKVTGDSIEPTATRLHTAFAVRFGEDEGGAQADGERPARASQLREAFNSPYWPFVLVSTSVGQEGLDFHPYCHVVVHWNLPTNPVDLEQREGRVHRYKGHAVRKNVAAQHRAGGLAASGDPWAAAFDLAAADRLPADNELVPYWIYPIEGGAAVERHVLALPLSRELNRFEALQDALVVYRLAFGQARQEDLIHHLLARLGTDRAAELAKDVRIDLRPRTPN